MTRITISEREDYDTDGLKAGKEGERKGVMCGKGNNR